MSQPRSPTVRRRILASELRRLRGLAKLTQQQAEEATGLTPGSISRYESCTNSIAVPAAEKLLRVYGVEDEDRIASLLGVARDARRRGWLKGWKGVVPPWFEDLVALERDASVVREFALRVIPGWLQTERYARTVLQAGILGSNVEDQVRARMARADVLDRDNPPEFWVVLCESALRCAVGGREVMREQLTHLAELAQRPGITIQVLPDSYGAHPSMTTWFTILSFELAPEFGVAYTDYLTGSLYRDEPDEVRQYERAYTHLIKAALPEPQSLTLIQATAKDLYS